VSSTGSWEEWFAGRHWRVAEEVTGTVEQDGVQVTFTRGAFTIAPPGAFRSALSTNLGRKGLLLQETDVTGAHDITGSRAVFGTSAVAKARERFGSVW
jgi:hypothetical protein